MWVNVLQMLHTDGYTFCWRIALMDKDNKSYSMSIRVSEEELNRLKEAAKLEAYASYSEFVRRTALLEANKILEKKKDKR